MQRYDLLRLPLVKPLLRSRWPQFVVVALALAGFTFTIISGFVGTPVGSRNFGVVLVWIAWWALLMLAAVPLFGRAWCSLCPIPAPGEWLQRGAVLGPAGKGLGLGRRWPNRLRSMWLQNGAFVLVALFSAVILTQPQATAVVLAALLFIAVGASMVFERRAFCRYLCPVGGFIGLYSQLAPVELRVIDPAVCAADSAKACYNGGAQGYGCPWQVFPGGLVKNIYCGTCLECLRTCPHDNIALNLRPFGADLHQPSGRKMDEAFKAFIMLGSAVVYSAVMLGPWGVLKMAAYSVGSAAWIGYATVFLALVLGLLPGSFWLAVRAGHWLSHSAAGQPSSRGAKPRSNPRGEIASPPESALSAGEGAARNGDLRRTFVAQSYSLVPLGLAAWIAFSLSFVFANLSYVWAALGDPLARGWNLFGLARTVWTPYALTLVPGLQTFVLLGGLGWSASTALNIARERLAPSAAVRQSAPVLVFHLAVTVGLLGLLIG